MLIVVLNAQLENALLHSREGKSVCNPLQSSL